MYQQHMLLKLRKPILKYTLNKYHVLWLSSFKHLKLPTCHYMANCLYTQLQKKPISHFSRQLWKSELTNEKILIPYSVAISSASFH